MPREKKSKAKANANNDDGEPPAPKSKKRRTSAAVNNAANQAANNSGGGGSGPNNPGQRPPNPGELGPPPPQMSYGETVYAGNPFDDFGSQSQIMGPGTPGTPGPNGMPMNQMMQMQGPPGQGPPPQGMQMQQHPHSHGPPPGHPGHPGQHPNQQQQGKPPPMMAGKVYPYDQPRVFNPANPNAPPIYPCGICHKEVHDNDQAILCESGCNFWFHRGCTGLTDYAYHLLNEEIYAEWACEKCVQTKNIPLVKFKP